MKRSAIILLVLLTAHCSLGGKQQQENQGMHLYNEYCSECHGNNAQGQDVHVPEGGMLDNGTYLAPALNEKGDIWAHPPELLFQKIKTGLLDEDPPMPKCEGRMTDNEIKLVIQHIYSLWPEDIRSAYAERFKNSAIINEINNPM